jgi:TonB family protein
MIAALLAAAAIAVSPVHFGVYLPRQNVLLKPAWVRTPTAAELAASGFNRGGGKPSPARVVIRCGLRPDGNLTSCRVMSESAKDHGYGASALKAVRYFRLARRIGPYRVGGGILTMALNSGGG